MHATCNRGHGRVDTSSREVNTGLIGSQKLDQLDAVDIVVSRAARQRTQMSRCWSERTGC